MKIQGLRGLEVKSTKDGRFVQLLDSADQAERCDDGWKSSTEGDGAIESMVVAVNGSGVGVGGFDEVRDGARPYGSR